MKRLADSHRSRCAPNTLWHFYSVASVSSVVNAFRPRIPHPASRILHPASCILPAILERLGAITPTAQIPLVLEPAMLRSAFNHAVLTRRDFQNGPNCGMENRLFRARSTIPKFHNSRARSAALRRPRRHRLTYTVRYSTTDGRSWCTPASLGHLQVATIG